MLEQITMEEYLSDLGLWCGRTYPERSQATTEKISEECLKKSQESLTREPMFLDLTGGIGAPLVSLWEMDIRSRGEYTTRNFGEKPSETAIREICSKWGLHSVAEDSRLSLILEARPHPKYFLSARACEGIIKRANKRGKTLPKKLEEALTKQAGQSLSLSEPGKTGAKAYSFKESDPPLSQPSTIKASCDSATAFVAGGHYRYTESETIGALTANDRQLRGDTPLVYGKSDFGTYKEDGGTLRASGGDYGGVRKC